MPRAGTHPIITEALIHDTIPKSSRGRQRLRRALELVLEQGIALLDQLDGDTDLEDTGDLEPSIGGEYHGQVDLEYDTSDDELSLGWLNPTPAGPWEGANFSDAEGTNL